MMPPCLYGLVFNCRVPRRRGIPSQLTNLWTVASREQFYTDFIILTSENQGDRDAKSKAPGLSIQLSKRRSSSVSSNRAEPASGEGKAHAFSRCAAHTWER